MSFNPVQRTDGLFTHQGGPGFAPNPKKELLLLVAGSFFSGGLFYEDKEARERRFAELAARVTQEDPEFVFILATYAHQVLGLCSGPAALLAHLFWWDPGEVGLRTAARVWLRGDEHLETLAYTKAQGWEKGRGGTSPRDMAHAMVYEWLVRGKRPSPRPRPS